ncbi:hypothetical protein V8G54_002211 [Vigna mungo]|uniref:Uncharacterized protein n=1 Tax=Vigna mungo TaxID=3915 RepID=A0AAQ3P9Z3_VIGMU
MALPAPTQLSYFHPTNFNLNSEFHSLGFKIEIAETKKPQKSIRRARVKGIIFDRNRERKERGRVQFSRVWRVGFGIDPEEGGASVPSDFSGFRCGCLHVGEDDGPGTLRDSEKNCHVDDETIDLDDSWLMHENEDSNGVRN